MERSFVSNLTDIRKCSWQLCRRFFVASPPLLGAALLTIAVRAADLDTQEKALKLIADTGDRICNIIETRGSSRNAEVTGDINAELKGLASKLADAGVKGSGKFSESSFQGVLQKDLASSVNDSAQCKLKVFEDLQAKLVQPVSSEPAEQHRSK